MLILGKARALATRYRIGIEAGVDIQRDKLKKRQERAELRAEKPAVLLLGVEGL